MPNPFSNSGGEATPQPSQWRVWILCAIALVPIVIAACAVVLAVVLFRTAADYEARGQREAAALERLAEQHPDLLEHLEWDIYSTGIAHIRGWVDSDEDLLRVRRLLAHELGAADMEERTEYIHVDNSP